MLVKYRGFDLCAQNSCQNYISIYIIAILVVVLLPQT